MRTIAITRAVPSSIQRCELTHLSRTPIDIHLARGQHAEYQRALAELGCEVIELPEEAELPDSVFVEDSAVVFDECAVITRPGAESRRTETDSIRAALAPYRTLHEITEPGTLDGGDVLCLGRRVFVGLSSRTNGNAVGQLQEILKPFDYEVTGVEIERCLHLKSAASVVADDLMVVDTTMVDPAIFQTAYLDVPANAANMLLVNGTVLCSTDASETAARLQLRGLTLKLIDNSELARAEGALTCCSLILPLR